MRKHKSKMQVFFMLFVLLLLIAVPVSAASYKKKMVTAADGYTYYYNEKGKIVKNKLVTYQKKTYGLDASGHRYESTLFKIKGKTYYASQNGAIAKNKFVTIDEKLYFFGSKGVRKTGWITYKSHTYYCPSSGEVVQSCWKKIGNYYYYFNSNGYLQKNKWVDGYYVNGKGRRISSKKISDEAQNADNKKKTISMKNIKQNPQLPTGCESVALTMVLKYYHFSLSKTTIASKYLPKSGSGNFVTAFAGSPFSYNGAGIYSPGLTTTANKFLKAKKSSLRAYNITGVSLSNLYKYIDNGTPVIVWNSMYMRNPIANASYYAAGRSWTFYTYEHCVVLCGYDKSKNKVLINDSLSGLVWRNKSSFERIYNKMGKMAVVIM